MHAFQDNVLYSVSENIFQADALPLESSMRNIPMHY
jgi:hypothetical protein